MMMYISILFTYILASLAVTLAALRLVGQSSATSPFQTILCTFGLGPIVIGLILDLGLTLLPGRPDWAYIAFVASVIGGLGLWGRRAWRTLPRPAPPGRLTVLGLGLGIGLAIVTGTIFFFALGAPVTENDAAQYAFVARRLYEIKSLSPYPFTAPDPDTGFYALSSHPPAYYCMIVWHYMIQGGADQPGLAKLISPAHAAMSALLLTIVMRRFGTFPMLGCAFIYLATPFFFDQTTYHSIDPIRMHMSLLALNALTLIVEDDRAATRIIAGGVIGLTIFSHSLGAVLIVPAFTVALLIESRSPWRRRFESLVSIGLVSALIGGWQYAMNIVEFGMPIQDSIPLYGMLPTLDFTNFQTVGGDMDGIVRLMAYGLFKPFTSIDLYGPWPWLALVYLVVWRRAVLADPLQRRMLWFAAVFAGIVAASVAAGSTALISSARYMMSMLMVVAVFSSLALERLRSNVLAKLA